MHVIRAGQTTVEVDERLGGEITRIRYGTNDVLASYDRDWPVRVSRSSPYGDPKLDWLSEYRGGWQLLVPNAGAACEFDGVPLPFHGEWSRTRVHVAARSRSRLTMRAGTRLPFTVTREVEVATGPDRVLVHTTVTNRSGRAMPFVWGEHPAFAVGPGDQVDLPAAMMVSGDGRFVGAWPNADGRDLSRIRAEDEPESLHFLTEFSEGWAAIRRPHVGVALAWEVRDFPCMWLWREVGSTTFPFFGRASILAIEPALTWPGDGLTAATERGHAIVLGPGDQRSTTVAAIPFSEVGGRVTGASVSGEIRRAA